MKQGAEEEARKQGVRITFEGPATEADIEQQMTMLTNALAKKPGRDRFRRAGQPGGRARCCEQAQAADIPVIAFDSGVESDIPLTTAATDNLRRPPRRPSTWPSSSAARARSRWSFTTRPA